MKIKKGDKVKMLNGKDRGKIGIVTRVIPKDSRVVIEGLNLVKKHRKAKRSGEKGQRVSVAAPVAISKLQLICPKCGKPTRIGAKVVEGKKFRICKKCQAEI